ncbi:Diadenylate cyclase spyDAC; Bacterial checkpoint controller DisA with nucleotide-binding domain [Olavius algarvensis associated proteobacterium Delta 3]|nr:Diadenylate cyclase spyDAC; Bacterial checkpoint controller DisA with nucleotide-binding domain [Olavius algarvensis associated proteobacterium Delta 3]
MEALAQFLNTMRWQDLLDIALASYILFRFYALFRGTFVFRVVTGLVFLWLFGRMAVFLGLIVTSWAIQAITAVAAFIIIVVFRHEIRSVLQAKNIKSILWGFSPKTSKTPIEIISSSAFELTRNHIGALMVFPGEDNLEEIIQKGIPWEGKISSEMILSIFWHGNPVHDGAIIISGDRILEVGAVLPLSRRKDLPSYFGTRHRAAAGLAESSDALVLVVSEERESIMVAKGSDLIEIPNVESLVRLIREHSGETESSPSNEVPQRVRMVAAALVSVMLVAGIWFSFTRGRDTIIALEMPIEYMNRKPKMEIIEASANIVRLQLSGSVTLIKNVRPEQVQVRLDLSDGVVGKNVYTIANKDVSLPPGIDLIAVKPQTIELTLDVFTRKRLPVQIDWVGKLDNGLRLESARINPKAIEVEGSSLILRDMSTIYTQQVPLENLRETGTINIGIALGAAALKTAPGSQGRVAVEYVIRRR